MKFQPFGRHRSAVRVLGKLGVCTLALSATGALAQVVAQAQTAGAAEASRGDDIIVTANKREERLSNIAGAVNVQTGDDLNQANATGLRDYIGNLPSVSLQTNGAPGFGRINIRGISGVTLDATAGTYIDDVPISAAGQGAAGGFLTPDLDPADLERVEVLKGPQGTLYGASGPGGLLKYVTKLPDTNNFSFGAKEEVSFVEKGGTGYSLRGHANIPIAADTVGLRVSGFYREDPGYIDNLANGEKNINDMTAKGFNANLLLKPSERLSIRINGLMYDLSADGMNAAAIDRVTLQPIFGKDDTSVLLRQGNEADFRHISGTINYEISPSVSLVSATSYSDISNKDRTDLTPDAPLPVLRFYNSATEKFTQEVRLVSAANNKFEWMIGGFYTDETSDGSTIFQPMTAEGEIDTTFPLFLDFVGTSKYREAAIFGNATYYFTPNFDVTLGLRWSHNKGDFVENSRGLLGNPDDPDTYIPTISFKQKDDVLTYLATARLRLTEDTMVFARAASAYQPGGPRSLPEGFPKPAGFTESYGPETLWNYEVGIRSSLLDRRLTISASAYYIDWKDMHGFVFLGEDLLIGATGSAGDAVSKGFELELAARPVDGLSLGAAIGYSDATLKRADPTFGAETGDALPYAPKYTVSLNGEYEAPISNDWTGYAGVNYRYLSDHFTNFESRAFTMPRQAIPLEGYELVDLRVGARSSNFDVTLFVKNLFDTYAYIADTTATLNGPAFESIVQPRTIGISVSQNF